MVFNKQLFSSGKTMGAQKLFKMVSIRDGHGMHHKHKGLEQNEKGSPSNEHSGHYFEGDESENFSDHRLTSEVEGSSEVEQIAERIELRRAQRLHISPTVRTRMLQDCHKIQQENGYPPSKIHVDALIEYRNQVRLAAQSEEKEFSFMRKFTKKPTPHETLLKVLDKAVFNIHNEQDEWFHYVDFQVYYTTVDSEWSMIKHPICMSLLWIISFYIFTPVFFCFIVQDQGVCQADNQGNYAWMSSLYFASATLSTVGYGDIHVTNTNDWYILSGIFYMILANVTLFCAFSSGQEVNIESPITKLNQYFIELVMGGRQNPQDLYSRIRRLKMVRIGQIALTFTFLNLVGAIVAKVVTDRSSVEPGMSWAGSLYWAIQTTTTIGYGDTITPFALRWFQVFYLILSTYFVGQALGGLASLKRELEEVRTMTAWRRREMSKGLIDEMQPENHDNKVDQYEFVVASLVILGKISSSDVVPIMNKYRELANKHGFISYIDPQDDHDSESSPNADESLKDSRRHPDSHDDQAGGDKIDDGDDNHGYKSKGKSTQATVADDDDDDGESKCYKQDSHKRILPRSNSKSNEPSSKNKPTKGEEGVEFSFSWFGQKVFGASQTDSQHSKVSKPNPPDEETGPRNSHSDKVYPEYNSGANSSVNSSTIDARETENVKARLAWLEQALFAEMEYREDEGKFDVEGGNASLMRNSF